MINFQTPYGSFQVEVPEVVTVDGEIGWTVVYTVGETGIKQGGSLKIIFPAYQHQRSQEYVQVYDYWKPHFLYAYCEDETLPIRTEEEKIPSQFSHIKRWPDSQRVGLIIAESDLPAGTKIYIHYGGIDRSWMYGQVIPTRVRHRSHKKQGTFLDYQWFIDVEGTKQYQSIEVFPPIQVVPDKEKYVTLIAPTFIQPGEKVKVQYLLKDRFYNPIFDKNPRDFTMVVRNLKTDKISPIEMDEEGHYNLLLQEEGIYELDVKDVGHLQVEKAVFFCRKSEYHIYWGDLHCHSSLTPNIRDNNGGASPEDAYTYAQEVSHLDFVGLSEQTFEFNEDQELNITKQMWNRIGELSDQYYKPGSLVTFPGFEFHSRRGDTVVLFGDSLSNFSYPDSTVEDLPDVWSYYGEDQYVTIPHFHRYCGGRRKKDQQEMQHSGFNLEIWKLGNKKQEVLCEIFSSQWGRFENSHHPMLLKAKSNIPNNTYVDFLNRGKPWGVTSGSDDHDAMPGHGGVTAIYAKEQSREAIFEGLQKRRTYATTHPRMGIEFYVDGNFMGEEVFVSDKGKKQPHKLKGQVVCPKRIKYVELIKNGEVIYREQGNYSWMEFSYEDKEVIEDRIYYYLRVKQVDGHIGWSSPIWFIQQNEDEI